MIPTELTGVVAEHIRAINAFDLDGIAATSAPDACVNDIRFSIWAGTLPCDDGPLRSWATTPSASVGATVFWTP